MSFVSHSYRHPLAPFRFGHGPVRPAVTSAGENSGCTLRVHALYLPTNRLATPKVTQARKPLPARNESLVEVRADRMPSRSSRTETSKVRAGPDQESGPLVSS